MMMDDFDKMVEMAGDALDDAVREALERKRKLGHYAVVKIDGETREVRGDEITALLEKMDAKSKKKLPK